MNLRDRHCQPRALAAASDAEATAWLAQLDGWRIVDGAAGAAAAIERGFRFANWLETLAFVNALGWICQVEDHHPDLAVSFDRCTVRFSTHSARGPTLNDFICAAKADALVAHA